MEVHVVGGHPVDGGLGAREPGEDGQRRGTDRVGEIGPLEQGPDVPPGPRGRVVADLDVDLGRAEASAGDRRADQPHGLDTDRVDRRLQQAQGHVGVHEGAEQHVPGDPG